MDRRDFLGALGAGAAGLALSRAVWATPARLPNIIVILVDDLGYGELSAQGCHDIATPRIDSIAANGVRFTDGYVSCPLCAPARAGLMTGRYQQRFGFEDNPAPTPDATFGLPRTETTLAERLRRAGYATGIVGKWHLGLRPELQPTRRGFDEFYGFLGGANAYLPGTRGFDNILRGNEPVNEKEYLTDAFGREAVAFIERRQEAPFFLYLALNAVHAPLQAPDAYRARIHGLRGKRRVFAAMQTAMDDNVGRVLDTLRRLNLEQDTLLFFLSDNGGPPGMTTSSNGALRGGKRQIWEGGIRIPFMAQWPGHIPVGQTCHRPVISLDIAATALSAAGQQLLPHWQLDGANLLPYLTGQATGQPHDTLYWRFQTQRAIRRDEWKLVVGPGHDTWELYNLADDIGEKHNVAAQQPDRVREMQTAWDAWNAQLMAPRWERYGPRHEGRGDLAQRFKDLDANGDGRLTAQEMGQPNTFRQMDANADGVVTLDEARAYPDGRGLGLGGDED
ncbi:sulfatase-like hydrolase/transferase [bacterium]|nr:sulfatase-like hydrolase/transferase [bacterium]